jgi:hypothetical protein
MDKTLAFLSRAESTLFDPHIVVRRFCPSRLSAMWTKRPSDLGAASPLGGKSLFVLLTETDSVAERIIHLQLQPPR